MFIRDMTEEEWEELEEELRKCLVAQIAKQCQEYKPTMRERIVCSIKYKKLKKLI